MIKVFLVEDEVIMREGIRSNIDWEAEGFEFVGEASDGELAYPLIQKSRPDILITDIQMPFMDGLELSRLVKQEQPGIKIIVLTGYDEFEYAKEGIRIGITDYLLKPIASAKLLEAVKKVGELVVEERQFQETFDQERQESLLIARQKFFRGLVLGRKSVSALLGEGRELGLDLAANRYNILLFQISASDDREDYLEAYNRAVSEIKEKAAALSEIFMVELGMEGWAFILMEKEEKDLEGVQREFMQFLRDTLGGYEGIRYFGGLGTPVGRLSELNKCYEEAGHAFAYRYLREDDQIIGSGDLPDRIHTQQEPDLRSLEVGKLDRRVAERFLKTGLKGEVAGFVDGYFAGFGEKNMESLLFRQYVVMDMYFAAVALLEGLGYGAEDLVERCGDIQDMTVVFSSAQSNREYLQKILEATIDLREAVSQKRYHSLLKEAKNYIRRHFEDEDISLNAVAASVNLSPNHFSSIFSQEAGQTFIEYLTSVRMERAKELLRTTAMKSSEIAYAVGYKDAHYFSSLFKKTQECTPGEFRQKV